MQINEIDIQKYTSLYSQKKSSFMQSPNWAQFKSMVSSYEYKFFEITDNSLSKGSFSVLVKNKKILGKSIKIGYLPRVIFFDNQIDNTVENISYVLSELKKRFSLVLVELNIPYWEENNILSNNPSFLPSLCKLSSFVETNLEIQPHSTVINDVKSTSNLEFYLSTLESRNAKRNIKKALKYMEDNRITFEVKHILNESELIEANDLFNEVSKNSHFIGRPLEYYKKLQETLSENILWYVMKKDGKLVLVNLAIKDNLAKVSNDLYVGKKIYLEEGSISYALKYLSFKYLDEIGFLYYDHWGVYLDPKSPKYGFSEFKIKFGGKVVTFPPIIGYSKYIPSWLLNLVLKVFKNAGF